MVRRVGFAPTMSFDASLGIVIPTAFKEESKPNRLDSNQRQAIYSPAFAVLYRNLAQIFEKWSGFEGMVALPTELLCDFGV